MTPKQQAEAYIETLLGDDKVAQSVIYKLAGIEQALVSRIREAGALNPDIAQWLMGAAQNDIAEGYVDMVNAASKGMARQVRLTTGEAATTPVIDEKTLNAWYAAQGRELIDRFNREVRLNMLHGETPADLIQAVRGTPEKGWTDGIMSKARSQSNTLTRTSIVSTANIARLQTMSDQGVEIIEWVSILDDVTTDICLELDGLRWYVPDDPEDYEAYIGVDHDIPFPGPIAHWNCRSVQVPVGQPIGYEVETSADVYPLIFQPKATFTTPDAEQVYHYIKRVSAEFIAAKNKFYELKAKAVKDSVAAGKKTPEYFAYAKLRGEWERTHLPRIREMLKVSDPSPVQLERIGGDVAPEMEQPIARGLENMRQILDKKLWATMGKEVKISEGLHSFPAQFVGDADEITLKNMAKTGLDAKSAANYMEGATMHELTHRLMMYTGLWEKERAFFTARAPNLFPIRRDVRAISLRKDFPFFDPYMKTLYGKRLSYIPPAKAQEIRRATLSGEKVPDLPYWEPMEIMTRAVEYYWFQPEVLAAKDPELFQFVYRMLHGLEEASGEHLLPMQK